MFGREQFMNSVGFFVNLSLMNFVINVICSSEANSSWTFAKCSWTTVTQNVASKIENFQNFADLSALSCGVECHSSNTRKASFMWRAISVLTYWSFKNWMWRHLASDIWHYTTFQYAFCSHQWWSQRRGGGVIGPCSPNAQKGAKMFTPEILRGPF